MEFHKQQFIELIAKSGILTFGNFVTKSGRQTPYFINFGNSKTGEQASLLGQHYGGVIEQEILTKTRINFLYGPAYKGIPLVVATSIELAEKFKINIPYCFNRKEVKDHGEGGNLIGYKPKPGDIGLIVEDVITAGTSVRESMAIFGAMTDVKIAGEIIAVDRMEKGLGEKSARQEAADEFGIFISSIVTVGEIVEFLKGRAINEEVLVTPQVVDDINQYLKQWGAKN